MRNKYAKLFVSLLLPQLAGAIGSYFTTSKIPTWYAGLEKSPLNPPGWVFGPVWVTLYLLMGIAFYLVWRQAENQISIKRPMAIYSLQLVLNVAWSLVFFGLENPLAALVVIAILWLAIIANIISFGKLSKPAAWLLVPYLLWVTFASYLTYAVWSLN